MGGSLDWDSSYSGKIFRPRGDICSPFVTSCLSDWPNTPVSWEIDCLDQIKFSISLNGVPLHHKNAVTYTHAPRSIIISIFCSNCTIRDSWFTSSILAREQMERHRVYQRSSGLFAWRACCYCRTIIATRLIQSRTSRACRFLSWTASFLFPMFAISIGSTYLVGDLKRLHRQFSQEYCTLFVTRERFSGIVCHKIPGCNWTEWHLLMIFIELEREEVEVEKRRKVKDERGRSQGRQLARGWVFPHSELSMIYFQARKISSSPTLAFIYFVLILYCKVSIGFILFRSADQQNQISRVPDPAQIYSSFESLDHTDRT